MNVLAENDTPSFILVNAIFLLGTFTFAVVLGVVSDDIGSELKARLFLSYTLNSRPYIHFEARSPQQYVEHQSTGLFPAPSQSF